jgi:hypothetical protein
LFTPFKVCLFGDGVQGWSQTMESNDGVKRWSQRIIFAIYQLSIVYDVNYFENLKCLGYKCKMVYTKLHPCLLTVNSEVKRNRHTIKNKK